MVLSDGAAAGAAYSTGSLAPAQAWEPVEYPEVAEVEAEMVVEHALGGRNQPIIVICDASKGAAVQCVVKPPQSINAAVPRTLYLLEAVASLLATRLGLRTPAPCAVRIPSELTALPSAARLRGADNQTIFGSRYVDGMLPVPTGAVAKGLREAAAGILAFDLFIHNIDRRAGNPDPNLRTLGEDGGFVVFDHDLAFTFTQLIIGAPDPVTDPLLMVKQDHIFWGRFGTKLPKNEEMRDRIAALTDAELDSLPSKIPQSWQDRAALARIVDVLKKRRSAISQWFPKLSP